jgi:hypothetical protein
MKNKYVFLCLLLACEDPRDVPQSNFLCLVHIIQKD